MKRKRKKTPSKSTQSAKSMIWLKAVIHFGTTFSYRQPDASAQFAIGSPVPSPATIKLALVDAAIRWNGDVDYGRQVFDWLKTCPVHPVPPERVVRFRVFLKRLKPREQRLLESTGIRDYFLLDGPLAVFLQLPPGKADEAKDLLYKLRKLGTSDSLCWCREVVENDSPDPSLCPQLLLNVQGRAVSSGPAQRFMVVRLSDLTERSQFEGFNPFRGRTTRAHLDKQIYLLPLTPVRYGETWTLLRRSTFS